MVLKLILITLQIFEYNSAMTLVYCINQDHHDYNRHVSQPTNKHTNYISSAIPVQLTNIQTTRRQPYLYSLA